MALASSILDKFRSNLNISWSFQPVTNEPQYTAIDCELQEKSEDLNSQSTPPPIKPRSRMSNYRQSRKTSVKQQVGLLVIIAVVMFIYGFINPRSPVVRVVDRNNIINPLFIYAHDRLQMESEHQFVGDLPFDWEEHSTCPDDHEFMLTFAVKQSNMEHLHEHVMSVADPASPTYRQFWTLEAIRDYFAPEQESLNAINEWLDAYGINGDVQYDEWVNAITCTVTCSQANELLGAEYTFYRHTTQSDRLHLRVKDGIYSVPSSIEAHLDFVSPTMRFPIRKMLKDENIEILDLPNDYDFINADDPDCNETLQDVNCSDLTSEFNIPPRLYSLYGMTGHDLDTWDEDTYTVRQSIGSWDKEFYNDIDLLTAWNSLSYAGSNDLSQMTSVPFNQSEGHGSEAELDTQYITATGPGIPTYVYYTNDNQDTFLPVISYIYKTWNEFYKGPSVLSISYGADEYEFGHKYCRRINREFGKLAIHGIGVVAASGDEGAVGDVDGDDEDCLQNGNGTSVYTISFPASAPYVTAVGASQGGSIDYSSATTGEIAVSFSGGGFSEYFKRHSWQADAIDYYFSQDIEFPDENRWTSPGMRAIPDISAQGIYYVIRKNNKWQLVSGTSCSCPVIAGMISMLNVNEVAKGRPFLGWMNPLLYRLFDDQNGDFTETFNDVIIGENYGCAVDNGTGWQCTGGWDPVTGVGTPKFDMILEGITNLDLNATRTDL